MENHDQHFFDRLSEKWGYVVYTGYDTSQIPVRKRPSLIKYFILILFYACLAGPGLYLILKKQGKRKYFWSGVTMLSVLFLGIVALLGTGTRLTAPVLTMRRMYTQQDHIWGETLQLGVQAPYNNTYQLYLDKSYHLTMSSESGYSAENVNTNITDKVEIYEKEDCYKLTFSRLPVFAGNAFFLNRDHAVSPEEEIQIHASGTMSISKADGRTLQDTESRMRFLYSRTVSYFWEIWNREKKVLFPKKSIPMEMEAWKRF